MVEEYKTIYKGGIGEITEKKSRFIATIRPVETEEEALAFLEEMKKKYWDARHNCSAYVLGERQEILRCSDDGEPSQTAGKPMMDVLTGAGLTNVAAVVTRYFGGTLLGTGGLVRAYSGAVQEGLRHSVVVEKLPGRQLQIFTDYNGAGKIQYVAAQMGIPVQDTEYAEQVTMKMIAPLAQAEQLIAQVTERTAGKARIEEMGEVYYGVANGEVFLL